MNYVGIVGFLKSSNYVLLMCANIAEMSQSSLRWQGVTRRKGLNFLGLMWAPRQKVDVFLIIKENAVQDVPAWNHTKMRQTPRKTKESVAGAPKWHVYIQNARLEHWRHFLIFYFKLAVNVWFFWKHDHNHTDASISPIHQKSKLWDGSRPELKSQSLELVITLKNQPVLQIGT